MHSLYEHNAVFILFKIRREKALNIRIFAFSLTRSCSLCLPSAALNFSKRIMYHDSAVVTGSTYFWHSKRRKSTIIRLSGRARSFMHSSTRNRVHSISNFIELPRFRDTQSRSINFSPSNDTICVSLSPSSALFRRIHNEFDESTLV